MEVRLLTGDAVLATPIAIRSNEHCDVRHP